MEIIVVSKAFLYKIHLFKKDFATTNLMLIEAASLALEDYFLITERYVEMPLFIRVKLKEKKYLVNGFLVLSNIGKYKFAEELKKEMIQQKLETMIDQDVIKI